MVSDVSDGCVLFGFAKSLGFHVAPFLVGYGPVLAGGDRLVTLAEIGDHDAFVRFGEVVVQLNLAFVWSAHGDFGLVKFT
jgi:hypothetical protein